MKHRLIFAMIVMVPGLLLAKGKGFCKAKDAYVWGKQNRAIADKPSQSPLVYTWRLRNLKPGNLAISIKYVCPHAGGSGIQVHMAGQTLESVIGNTGVYLQGSSRGQPKSITQEVGTIMLDQAGSQMLKVTVGKGAGIPYFEFDGILLKGKPMVGAQITAYKHPVKKRTAKTLTDHKVPHNTLSAAEKKAKWELLFNGQDRSGWYRFHHAGLDGSWIVDDGALHLGRGGSGYLMSIKEYTNFELMIDWKISAGGNSGIMLRATEAASGGSPGEQAIEIQVLDHLKGMGKDNPKTTAGAVFDLYGLKHPPVNAVGDWNTTRVIVNGYRYQVYLNGEKTADFRVGSSNWYEALYDSGFWQHPGFGLNTKGSICLQARGDDVWFRSIKIRPF